MRCRFAHCVPPTTSGGLAPVADGGGQGHSVFATYFLKGLSNPPRDVFVPSDLMADLKYNVGQNAPKINGERQVPILGVLEQAGAERGAEFVFIRRKPAPTATPAASEWERRLEEARRNAADEAARAQAAKRLEEARAAFTVAQQIDAMPTLGAAKKVETWQSYVKEFEATDWQLDEARRRLAFWKARVVSVPAWAKVSRAQIEYAEKNGLAVAKELDLGGGLKLRLVLIPAGEFTMGGNLSPEEVQKRWPEQNVTLYVREHPRHRTVITKPFYMGVTEVTREQFARFAADAKCKTDIETAGQVWTLKGGKWGWQKGASWRDPGFKQADDHPAVLISWNDATMFNTWLGKRAGLDVRLPSEAEWEYACRAGTTTPFIWGDKEEGAQGMANVACAGDTINWGYRFQGVKDGFTFTSPVGTYKPNAWGLYDIIGNAWEWCQDSYDAGYYRVSPAEDPPGPTDRTGRVARGGCWYASARICRSAFRDKLSASFSDPAGGFRVCVGVGPAKTAETEIKPGDVSERQKQYAGKMGMPLFKEISVGGVKVRMVLIPPGQYRMGSPASAGTQDRTAHGVTIEHAFYMSVTEITQQQWWGPMGTRPWEGKPGAVRDPNAPATCISWDDAVKWCQRATQSQYVRVRMPTEAEWEYACRAGTTTNWSFGDREADLAGYAWYKGTVPAQEVHPQRVGAKKPNPWGLYDMYGNAWEWCQDWYDAQYYRNSPGTDPKGPTKGAHRVLRGGGYDSLASEIASPSRWWAAPTEKSPRTGFRVVLLPDERVEKMEK